MGFLSVYDGTRKIVLGDPDRGYWAEIREHVSQGEQEVAERQLSKVVMVGGNAMPQPDVARYRQLMVVAAVKSWNLDDDSGQIWPVDLKHIQMLPSDVFDHIWEMIDKMNQPRSPEEQRQFHAADVSGDSDGGPGAAEPVNLPIEA